jgi:hypothetical protein
MGIQIAPIVLSLIITTVPGLTPPQDYHQALAAFYKEFPDDVVPTMKLVFEPKAVRVRSRIIELKGKNRRVLSEQTLWFSQGELVILHTPVVKEGTQDLHLDNFVTSKDGILYWRNGSRKGERLRREPADTLWFTWYSLDPMYMMACFHEQFVKQPDLFRVTTKNQLKTVMQRERSSDFFGHEFAFGVAFSNTPLWFHRLHIISDRHIVMEHDKPEKIKGIPFTPADIPQEIEFRDSTKALRHFMFFL